MALLRFSLQFHREFLYETQLILKNLDSALAVDEIPVAQRNQIRKIRSQVISLSQKVTNEALTVRVGRYPQLTPAESLVASELQSGKLTREIAKSLHISETTVKTHLKHIYAKLEVRNRAEAIGTLLSYQDQVVD